MEKKDRYRKSMSGSKVGVMFVSLIFMISMSFSQSASAWSTYELCVFAYGHLGADAVQDCVDEIEGAMEDIEEEMEDAVTFEDESYPDGSAPVTEGYPIAFPNCGSGSWACRP